MYNPIYTVTQAKVRKLIYYMEGPDFTWQVVLLRGYCRKTEIHIGKFKGLHGNIQALQGECTVILLICSETWTFLGSQN